MSEAEDHIRGMCNKGMNEPKIETIYNKYQLQLY